MSEKLLTATVEIFHDAECGTLPTEPILEGIAMISAIAGRLEVVRAARQLVVSKRNAPGVEPHKIHWPAFDADINVVITERPFDLGRSDDYADLSAEATIMGVALRWQ